MQRSDNESLPLPISQLLRRAANAKTPLERHLGAFYLFEATLKLLASISIVEYVAGGERDERVAARLQTLARPTLGHWWEYTRLLVPILARRDPGFAAVNELLGKDRRHDFPLAAGLDGLLKEVLLGKPGKQTTVRIPNLIDRLVQYRNQQMGHGAAGQKSAAHHDRLGRALLAGLRELLRKLDVTAGRQLVFIDDVRRLASGAWTVEGVLLTGSAAERLPPREIPDGDPRRLPRPKLVYTALGADVSRARELHPFLTYDADSEQAFFLNGRKGRADAEYLCYSSGRIHRANLDSDRRELLSRALGVSVSPVSMNQWAAASLAEEGPADADADGDAEEGVETLGEFELVSRIGRGAMGVVYRAIQPSVDREVALKCLLHTGDERAERRFSLEIQTLGCVDHPNLVKIYTSGVDGDRWFYAMEFIDGVNLSQVLQRLSETPSASIGPTQWQHAVTAACHAARKEERPVGPDVARDLAAPEEFIPPADFYVVDESRPIDRSGGGRDYVHLVVDIVRQVALAAHALHGRRVLHRDIKPGNIMLLADGRRAVLMDLGLAKLLDETGGPLTRTRQFVGTLRYASPEQVLAAGGIDARSDVYSLGVTLWELLTLRPMYGATERTPELELMNRIQFQEPQPAGRYNPAVPPKLEAILEKCLRKDPALRYASARELADDLAGIISERPSRPASADLPRRVLTFLRRHRIAALIVCGAVMLQLLIVCALWLIFHVGGGSRGPDAPPPTVLEPRVERGRLELSEVSDVYVFHATQGARITLDLTSSEFDTYLSVHNSDPAFELINDDYQGDTRRSRLEFDAPRTGDYRVTVGRYNDLIGTILGTGGAYELKIQGASE